mgnify:CR=1 FL=1
MPEVKWSSELSVGIAEIDEQHQHFIELLNALHRAVRSAKDTALTFELLGTLSEWLVTHIRTSDKRYAAFLRDKDVS